MTSWQGGSFEHDGESLYWEAGGFTPGATGEAHDGEVIVLCHGAGGNHACWFQQVPYLTARGYRVVTWDHRGFGSSTDRAGKSGPDEAVGDLAAVLDHVGVESAHVIGQSMGGWTALGFALCFPARVRSLVLADSLGGCHVPGWAERAATVASTSSLQIGHHVALGPRLQAEEPEKAFLYQQLGGFGRPFGAGLSRTMARALVEKVHDLEQVAAVACPVLCLVGEDDQIFPPEWMRLVADSFRPAARLEVIPGAGHSPYFETPARWNELVAGFLAVSASQPTTAR